ncbi:hypothetical protein FJV83_24210 [Mesorhizobium sp. WSM4307]|uniref:hypothetical protein n=1 Tax=unclassified Mesorhizobium TaxID=325217 RepID=UPI00115F1F39|nr:MULTISPECIES: hypothetical protein [unclassified Mesorhizobium]TRC76884.1 hypothetical protein FJV81_14750 [Mesorhizobium sp. WSM4315]TRC81283.1 hypothetical protein FJV83_24210 [Mesorhizobium sp. WSM4307]
MSKRSLSEELLQLVQDDGIRFWLGRDSAEVKRRFKAKDELLDKGLHYQFLSKGKAFVFPPKPPPGRPKKKNPLLISTMERRKREAMRHYFDSRRWLKDNGHWKHGIKAALIIFIADKHGIAKDYVRSEVERGPGKVRK